MWNLAKPGLNRAELVGCLLVALVLLPLVVWSAFAVNGLQQRATLASEAASIEREVGARIDKLDTLMTALVGMHYAGSHSDENEQLVAFAEQLQAQAPYVSGMGRWTALQDTARTNFEQQMDESGLYAFRIVAIDENGGTAIRESRPRYYPITMLEPMDLAKVKLLGADLGTIEGLGPALDDIVTEDRPLLTTVPGNWPMKGELLLFRAAYRGKHPPADAEGRRQQFDGGYWIAADPVAMIESIDVLYSRFDIGLHIDQGRTRHTLLERFATTLSDNHSIVMNPQAELVYQWPVGDARLTLTLAGEVGMPNEFLGVLILLLALILILTVLAVAFNRHRRMDAAERERSQATLNSEREKAHRTLNAIEDAVITLDSKNRVLHLNPSATELIGRPNASTLGQPLTQLLTFRHESDGKLFKLDNHLAALADRKSLHIDLVPESGDSNQSDGSSSPQDTVLRLSISQSANPDDETAGHILVLRDISGERKLTRKLEFQANHDALTGCTNRLYFENRLRDLLDDIPHSALRHALCYIDLDQFKVVNDTCGHGAGDRLLQDLTGNLSSLCRKGDVLSRLGGDEFGLLLLDISADNAKRIADKVHDFFQNYVFHYEGRGFSVRASIGFVPLDENWSNVGDVLAAADLACYAAKDRGRNNVYVYAADDAAMYQRSSELQRLPELQKALQEDRFRLHVQPIAKIDRSLAGYTIEHFEFLLRLTAEDGSEITPFTIIEAAERYGLMRQIDRWVIRQALRMVADIGDGQGSDCGYSINLSGQSAADPTLIDFIEAEYAALGINPTQIWFELTETAAISNFSVAVELARRIREMGSGIALDDFGSGLSSFGYLKNLPIDVLKIDGQFVQDIVDNTVDQAMVRAINEVARSMGILTIAEFVESQAAVDVLRDIGIDYVQGYHIGKPGPLPIALTQLLPVNRAA